ncbi:Uronate isomerase [Sulfitobacter noctilucicola]|uniref:Altronate hydrolase n=1 Tax=Sulfitobacter noctilucicola TaxID=1342301 RepID=A0A7W6Q454_9RHOB|nr:altronate dehydratase family protein [Sulfitobacter noctilucicola]KIN62903.1 Uronate isomerase [Sulfitobacter noctilucicola]MBB4172567.1 altronate hydrolase [Sulfitobacter noctilucicola]
MSHLVLKDSDSILVLTRKAPAGNIVVPGGVPLVAAVNPGHKIARQPIATGDPIRKLGHVIGFATADIALGEHVHTHNCGFGAHPESTRYGQHLEAARAAVPLVEPRTFDGYLRKGGHVGTRNMIALIATVNCSATVIRKAADVIGASGMLDAFPNVDGVVALAHGGGCGMDADGLGAQVLERVLWGYATHPNVGAAVFVGLGCEVMQIARMKQKFQGDSHQPFHGITIQEAGGTQSTVAQIVTQVQKILSSVNAIERTPQPLSALTIGLQCGGSDGYSGISANPALGAASDLIVGHGGRVMLSETPEIYGAEQLLLDRVDTERTGTNLSARLRWWEGYTQMHGGSMDNNPSPGNKAGGLTTILEKSLGAVAKSGSTPLNEVIAYAEKPTKSGLIFMDTPGYDPVSVTGQIAGGAQIVVFTTGRGSAFGSKPAPTIKLATNDRLFAQMPDDMDINCGDIVSGDVSIAQKGAEILDHIVETASGRRTKSEVLGLGDHEFVPWQLGAVM